jgi:hypothetical protein
LWAGPNYDTGKSWKKYAKSPIKIILEEVAPAMTLLIPFQPLIITCILI